MASGGWELASGSWTDANSQPPDAIFSIFQECQSSESEVLVWVSPSHSSSTRDLEKPILALPLHWIGPFLSFLEILSGFNFEKTTQTYSSPGYSY